MIFIYQNTIIIFVLKNYILFLKIIRTFNNFIVNLFIWMNTFFILIFLELQYSVYRVSKKNLN